MRESEFANYDELPLFLNPRYLYQANSKFFGIVQLTYVPPAFRAIDEKGACPTDMPRSYYPLGGKESFP